MTNQENYDKIPRMSLDLPKSSSPEHLKWNLKLQRYGIEMPTAGSAHATYEYILHGNHAKGQPPTAELRAEKVKQVREQWEGKHVRDRKNRRMVGTVRHVLPKSTGKVDRAHIRMGMARARGEDVAEFAAPFSACVDWDNGRKGHIISCGCLEAVV